jgi:hypothetical protein
MHRNNSLKSSKEKKAPAINCAFPGSLNLVTFSFRHEGDSTTTTTTTTTKIENNKINELGSPSASGE